MYIGLRCMITAISKVTPVILYLILEYMNTSKGIVANGIELRRKYRCVLVV